MGRVANIDRDKEIIDLYENGRNGIKLSLKEIAQVVGISAPAVSKRIKTIKEQQVKRNDIALDVFDPDSFEKQDLTKGYRKVTFIRLMKTGVFDADGKEELVQVKETIERGTDHLILDLAKKGDFEAIQLLQGKINPSNNINIEKIIKKDLFREQRDLVFSSSRYRVALCSRRAGKTYACAAALILECLKADKDKPIITAYIGLVAKTAHSVIIPTIEKICRHFDIDVKINSQAMIIEFSNKSKIFIHGNDSLSDSNKLLGSGLSFAIVDEAQSHRQKQLRYLIDEVIEPALAENRGSLVVIGTPPPKKLGYFYEISNNSAWDRHHWTILDNPEIDNAQEIIEEACKRSNLDINSSLIQRQWFGRFVEDPDSLIYSLNDNSLFSENSSLEIDFYVIGVDIGYNDSDAVAVIGCDKSGVSYLVDEFEYKRQTISTLIEQLSILNNKYKPIQIVIDEGGLGKKIAASIREQSNLNIVPAEKVDKIANINILNDALQSGKFKIKKDGLFFDEANLIEWDFSDNGEKILGDVSHTDIGDAVLYAFRKAISLAPLYTQSRDEAIEEGFTPLFN